MNKLRLVFIFLLNFLSFAFAQNNSIDTILINKWINRGEKIIFSNPDSAMILFENVNHPTQKNITLNPLQTTKNLYLKKQSIALNDIGVILNYKGDYKIAVEYFIKSLKIDERFGDELGIASSLNNISNLYFSMGNITSALNNINKSLFIFKKYSNEIGMADAYNTLGYYYDFLGDLKVSINYYSQSRNLYEKNNQLLPLSKVLNNIGSIYNRLGQFEKAIEYYTKSLHIKENSNDKTGIALSLNNIGKIFLEKGEYEKALFYYQKSRLLRIEIGDKTGLALALNNIAGLYKLKNILDSAKKYYTESIILNRKISNNEGLSTSLQGIGAVYLKENNTTIALKNAKESFKIAKQLGFPDYIRPSALLLKEIYKKLKNYSKAFEYQEIYHQMKDSLNNVENKKAGLKSQYKYEYDKKAIADSVANAKSQQIKTAQIAKQKSELNAKKNQQYALFFGLFLVMMFAGFMYNRFIVIQKQKSIISKQKHEVELQKQTVEEQKHLIEEHQKETIDSINYAKRIQFALLANAQLLKQYIPQHFVLFNPKDIVSGDFYWATTHNSKFYLAVCDSTGHGVPGAFMSLLNMGFLSEAIKEKNIFEPNKILNYVRKRLIESIGSDGQQDGMDAILICMDTTDKKTITYAAANNEPILISKNQIVELPKDKMPVGKGEKTDSFTLQTIEINKGDTLYLYTDGYADQFGGPKGKKFKYKQLNELLLDISNDEPNQQLQILNQQLTNWKGDLEQVDDICIIGIKV